jgi:hypothetical protein
VLQRHSVENNQRFEGSCCLHFREERRIMFPETSAYVYQTTQSDMEENCNL